MKVKIDPRQCQYYVIRDTGTPFDGFWYEFPLLSYIDYVDRGSKLSLIPNGCYEVRNDGEVAVVFVPAHTLEGEVTNDSSK